MAIIKHPKHSTGPVNAGEERLFKFLEVNLPDDYILVPNAEVAYTSPQGSVQYLEFDCLVVAPHAVYNIENKDWAGFLEGNDHAWFINNTERANPHKTVAFKTRILASRLKSEKPAWGAAWIAGVVTLSHPKQNKFGLDKEEQSYNATFLLNNELIEYITNPATVRKHPDAIVHVQQEIADFLAGQSSFRTPKEKSEVINLKIVETLQKTEKFTEYLCVPQFFSERRFKVREYPLDPVGKSPAELQNYQLKVQNTMLAQDNLPPSPYIVKAECRVSDDGMRYYEKSDYMDENTLRSELRRRTFTQMEKAKILHDIAHALQIAHDANVWHREVSPENIYLLDGNAALANFGRAWFVQHHEFDITKTAVDIEDATPFQAPELFDDDVSKATDIFSFGVIAYELMTGKVPFKNFIELAQMGGKLPANKLPSAINSAIPAWVDELCSRTITDRPEERWDNIGEIKKLIEDAIFRTEEKNNLQTATLKSKLQDLKKGDMITNEMVLYEEIGSGGYAKVFKGKHTIYGKFYALKIFAEDLNMNSVIDEYNALTAINHRNVVKFTFAGITNGGLFYTIMELLEGENLRTFTQGDLRLPVVKVYQMAKEILSALVMMQSLEKPIYHRDIKPNNIVWDKRERFVLIDFNIATNSQRDKNEVGTLHYIAPDLGKSKDAYWDASADTFALGVTIYELLTHTHPWAGNKIPSTEKPAEDILKHNNRLSPEFAAWIMKSIGSRKSERFATAKEMQYALLAIGEDKLYRENTISVLDTKGQTLSIVDYINSLYSQTTHGNAGTRAGWKESTFDTVTYTQTKLDKKLLQSIQEGQYKLIIITGNAGDGKTAFIRRVEGIASNVQRLSNRNGANFTIKGVPFQSNYDGSQDEEELANNEVLTEFFKPFEEKNSFHDAPEGRIIAINEGRLVDFLQSAEKHRQLYDIIDEYFYQEGKTKLPEGLMIINLNLRSVTAMEPGEESLLRSQIKKLTNPDLWGDCSKCPLANRCFIKYNVDSFTDSAAGDEVINRLEWLVRTLVYKKELHITIRDLRSMISYMLTRDFSCAEVGKLLEDMDKGVYPQEYYWQFYYFNLTASDMFLGKMVPQLHSEDRIVRLLRETDVAMVAIPSADRDLYYKPKSENNYLIFADRTRSVIPEFNQAHRILASYQADSQEINLLKVRFQSFVRHQYFEGQFDFKKRLPYQSLSNFYEKLNGTAVSLDEVMQSLAKAISNSEGCWDEELSKNNLILAASHISDPLSFSYRRFPLSEFELLKKENRLLTNYIEYENDSFIFRHKTDKHIQLSVSLDLYEMLYYISKGFNPSVNDLRGRFIELQVFKNLLESKTYTEVLVTQNNKTFFTIALDTRTNNIHIAPLNKNEL